MQNIPSQKPQMIFCNFNVFWSKIYLSNELYCHKMLKKYHLHKNYSEMLKTQYFTPKFPQNLKILQNCKNFYPTKIGVIFFAWVETFLLSKSLSRYVIWKTMPRAMTLEFHYASNMFGIAIIRHDDNQFDHFIDTIQQFRTSVQIGISNFKKPEIFREINFPRL